jgi:hypothetical protein
MKHQPVIDLRHPVVGPVERVDQPLPIPRQQIRPPHIRVDILLQELAGKGLETLVEVEPVMHRRKAAARDGSDIVELVQQRTGVPVFDDRDLPQAAQHAMGEGGGTLAAAGKRHDEHDLALRPLQHRQQRIPAAVHRHPLGVLRQRLVCRHERSLAAAEQQSQSNQKSLSQTPPVAEPCHTSCPPLDLLYL